jgi:predicted  nucleic acid-binding Zn-ribbon protein
LAEEQVNIKVLIDATKSSKSIEELEGNVEQLNKELSKVDKGSDEFDALSKAVDDSDKQMKELALSTDKTTATIGELEKSIEVLTNELKGVERGSDEFNKLSKELIKANGELKNIELSLEALDTEQVASELGSVTGAVGDVTSAFILLGGEGNRTLEQIGRNLEIAIGLSTGVKGAIEGIQSGIKLWNKYGNEIKESTAFTKIATIAQGDFNEVQKAFALATATGTKALKVLKVALISTGIGAIVVGIGVAVGLIISNWEKLKKSFKSGAIGKALKIAFFPITIAIEAVKALYSLLTTGSASTLRNLEKERKAREDNARQLVEESKLHVENSKAIAEEAEELRKTAQVAREASDERLANLEQQLRVQQALNGNTAETRALELELAQQRKTESEDNLKDIEEARNKQKEALEEANKAFKLAEKARQGFAKTSEEVQNKTFQQFTKSLDNLKAQASAFTQIEAEFTKAKGESKDASDALEVTEASQAKGRRDRAEQRKKQQEQDAKDEEKRLEDIQKIEEDLFQRGLESEEDRQARRLTLQFEANRKRIEELVKDDEKLKILLKQNEEQFFKDLEKIEENFQNISDKKRKELADKQIQTARDISRTERKDSIS